MIWTRLHVLADLAFGDPLVQLRMMNAITPVPHFSLAPDLVAVMTREDVQKSILAMVEAGIARLPFAPTLIEFSLSEKVRRFVLVDEHEAGFTAEVATLHSDRLADVSASKVAIRVTATGLGVEGHRDEAEGIAVAFAVSAALLMLNIKGVEKQVVQVDKLNRARGRLGRTRVPSHTLVRIGTIFDRQGRGESAGTGRKMPVHLRAGHVRNQACGPELSEHRPVYILPVLVNYRDGEAEPRPVRRRVAV